MVALTESWGEHVGVLYMDRKYSSITDEFSVDLEELYIYTGFIPEGIHNDLVDGINLNEENGISDNVEGATLLQLYYLLDNGMSGYKNDVLTNSSATGDINDLFSQYGY